MPGLTMLPHRHGSTYNVVATVACLGHVYGCLATIAMPALSQPPTYHDPSLAINITMH